MVEPEGFIRTHILIRGGGRDPVTLTIESRIGSGGQATVYKGMMSNLGEVAIRRINIEKKKDILSARLEIASLKNTRLSAKENKAGPENVEGCEPNINCFYGAIRHSTSFNPAAGAGAEGAAVPVFDAFEYTNDGLLTEGGKYILLIYEFIKGESLFELLKRAGGAVAGAGAGALTFEDAVSYVRQLLSGVVQMHKKDVVHLDLKPENIMITNEKVLKIIDFGLAKKSDDFSFFPGFTYNYFGPEGIILEPLKDRDDNPVVFGVKLNNIRRTLVSLKALDMFAVGCIIYELFVGKKLFPIVASTDFNVSAIENKDIQSLVNDLLKTNNMDLINEFFELCRKHNDFMLKLDYFAKEKAKISEEMEKPNIKKENIERFQSKLIEVKHELDKLIEIKPFLTKVVENYKKKDFVGKGRPTAEEALARWDTLFPGAAGATAAGEAGEAGAAVANGTAGGARTLHRRVTWRRVTWRRVTRRRKLSSRRSSRRRIQRRK
jgi:serine/threonine protein kinase